MSSCNAHILIHYSWFYAAVTSRYLCCHS